MANIDPRLKQPEPSKLKEGDVTGKRYEDRLGGKVGENMQPEKSDSPPKPGVYEADGDDWLYKVNTDGSVEVKLKDGDSWIKARPGSGAHTAIMGQFSSGILKPSALEVDVGPTEEEISMPDVRKVAMNALEKHGHKPYVEEHPHKVTRSMDRSRYGESAPDADESLE